MSSNKEGIVGSWAPLLSRDKGQLLQAVSLSLLKSMGEVPIGCFRPTCLIQRGGGQANISSLPKGWSCSCQINTSWAMVVEYTTDKSITDFWVLRQFTITLNITDVLNMLYEATVMPFIEGHRMKGQILFIYLEKETEIQFYNLKSGMDTELEQDLMKPKINSWMRKRTYNEELLQTPHL